MIVSQLEGTLIRQGEVQGIAFVNAAQKIGQLLLIIVLLTMGQLVQMLLG